MTADHPNPIATGIPKIENRYLDAGYEYLWKARIAIFSRTKP